MIAMVANAATHAQNRVVGSVLTILKSNLAAQLSKTLEEIDQTRTRVTGRLARNRLAEFESNLQEQKTFYAGLQTHEDFLRDFLIYRARATTNLSGQWKWSPGGSEPIPTASPFSIPELRADLTAIPDELRCPISQDILLDSVRAADGHVYSRIALQ